MKTLDTNNATDTEADLAKIVAAAPGRRRLGKVLLWLFALLALSLAAGATLLSRFTPGPGAEPAHQTQSITRGSLRVTVTATGQLEPTSQVDVGVELSGTVATVLVDYNDRIRKGQVLARLDVTKLQDQIAQTKAALEAAEARLLLAKATVKEAHANLARLQGLARRSDGKFTTEADLTTAEAQLARAEADEASARADVAKALAMLHATCRDAGGGANDGWRAWTARQPAAATAAHGHAPPL